MQIKLSISLTDGAKPNDIIEVSDDEAARMIEAGFAVAVSAPVVEKAALKLAKETR